MIHKAIDCAEAAYLLRRALGPVRSWDKALDEMRRDEGASYRGLRLKPCARERKGYPRPIYLLRDVAEFIREARRLSTGPLNPSAIVFFEVEFDPTIIVRGKHARSSPRFTDMNYTKFEFRAVVD